MMSSLFGKKVDYLYISDSPIVCLEKNDIVLHNDAVVSFFSKQTIGLSDRDSLLFF